MTPLKKTIIITSIIFILMGGFVFVLMKKQQTEKATGHQLSFRKFLGFETSITNPIEQSANLTTKALDQKNLDGGSNTGNGGAIGGNTGNSNGNGGAIGGNTGNSNGWFSGVINGIKNTFNNLFGTNTSCTNGGTNYPSCTVSSVTKSCLNSAANYPLCTTEAATNACLNGATNPPLCTQSPDGQTCANLADNYPLCTTIDSGNTCLNGANNPPLCTQSPDGKTCANLADNYPMCSTFGSPNRCLNGAINPPTCTHAIDNKSCTNSADNYPDCTTYLPNNKCLNGDIDPPSCTKSPTDKVCVNGATNPPSCTKSPTDKVCVNGATDYPLCTTVWTGPTLTICENGAINPPLCTQFGTNTSCTNGAGNYPLCNDIIVNPIKTPPGPTPKDNTAICSTTDLVIEFTTDEQAELADLQAQFDELAPNLFNSYDVESLQSDYNNFYLINKKVSELKDYFKIQVPKLPTEYAGLVSTPFYSEIYDSTSLIGAPNPSYEFIYNPFYNPDYPTDPNKQVPQNDALIEKLFQLNIW